TVGDVMTRQVVTVGPAETFKTCANLMRVHGVSALPVVVAGDRVAGIVSEADLMLTAGADDPSRLPAQPARSRRTAADMMTRDVVTISPGATVAAAARTMHEHHVKRLPVV